MPLNTAQIIHEAREELKQRVATREQNDKRIVELRILLRSLVRFLPDEGHRQQVLSEVANAKRKAPSLTDAISEVLMQSKTAMTSNELRDQLEANGFDLDDYSQPLASIQSTLQRLVDSSRVRRDLNEEKAVIYIWQPEEPRTPQWSRGTLAKEMANRNPGEQIADLKAILERGTKKK